jgi:hypothetical protein
MFGGSEPGVVARSVGVLARGGTSWPSLLKLLEIALKMVDLLQFQRPEWTRSVAARIVVPEVVARNARPSTGSRVAAQRVVRELELVPLADEKAERALEVAR